jgi:hypothetical protein
MRCQRLYSSKNKKRKDGEDGGLEFSLIDASIAFKDEYEYLMSGESYAE